MKWEAHSRVVAAIQEWAETQGTVTDPGPSRKTPLVELLLSLADAEDTSFEVVRSIYSQYMKAYTRTARSRTRGTPSLDAAREYDRYTANGHTMVDLARDHRMAPYSMACAVLEGLVDVEHPVVQATEATLPPSKGKVAQGKVNRRRDLIKSMLPTYFAPGQRGGHFPIASTHYTAVTNEVLHRDVTQCILTDESFGPLVDRIRHTVGLEYEYLLQEKLRQLNVSFLSEDIQKTNRHVRTPDCALLTPIEVHGHVCHWVESKASFGDAQTLEDNEREQFHSYVERVGPGVVIYWFDFVEDHPDVDLDEWRERGILVVSDFPDDIVPRPDLPVKLPASFTDQTRLLKSQAERDQSRAGPVTERASPAGLPMASLNVP